MAKFELLRFIGLSLFFPLIVGKLLEPKSEIRFGWGMLFDYHGQVLHGLNRYHLMIGLEIPDLRNYDYYTPLEYDPYYCEKYKTNKTQVLYATCTNTWPAYLEAIDKMNLYRSHVHDVLEKQLPAIIPGFKIEDVEPIPVPTDEFREAPRRTKRSVTANNTSVKKSRRKRWIADLISLGIQGISAYMQHRKRSKLEKGMRLLHRKQDFLNDRVVTLEEDMMSLARTTLKDLETIRHDMHSLGMDIRYIAQDMRNMEIVVKDNRAKLEDHENAIFFLSNALSVLLARVERYLAMYQMMVTELDHLMDALDNLSNNLLSHTVVTPEVLKGMIDHVKQQIKEYYPDYELVLTEVHEYYNLPFVTYAYEKGVIGIQVPLFIKPRLQESLFLYDIRTIPVPYHMNDELMDKDESEYTYTEVVPDTQMLAMSSDTYLGMDKVQLEQCMKVSVVYFCEQLLLIKHKSEHTCESAIYHDQSPDIILDKCNIKYYPFLDPEPQLLDAGNHILLGNLPLPWTVHCDHDDQIPNPIQGSSYVVVKKSDLCECSISAGKWYVEGNIAYCPDRIDTHVQLFYTINMAVMVYQFKEKMVEDGITDITLYKHPITYDPIEPMIITEDEDEVLDTFHPPVLLEDAMRKIEVKRYATKQDYAMAMNDPENWFSGDNKWYGFIAIACIIAMCAIPVILFILVKFFGLKIQFNKMNSVVTKLLAKTFVAQQAISSVPGAECYRTECLIQAHTDDLVGTVLKLVCIFFAIYLLYRSIRFMYHFFNMVNLSAVQTKETLYNFLLYDKTDIYLQLTHNYGATTVSLYVGTFFGDPETIEIVGNLSPNPISLNKGIFVDFVQVRWNGLQVTLRDVELMTPPELPIYFWRKWFVRYILNANTGLYKLIAYNPTTCKVRSLTQFQSVKTRAETTVGDDPMVVVVNTERPVMEPAGRDEFPDEAETEL